MFFLNVVILEPQVIDIERQSYWGVMTIVLSGEDSVFGPITPKSIFVLRGLSIVPMATSAQYQGGTAN